jgi:hypothetical protein
MDSASHLVMANSFYVPSRKQPYPGGPNAEGLVGAVNVSSGAADAGKVVLLNASGKIDPSMGRGSGRKPTASLGTSPSHRRKGG